MKNAPEGVEIAPGVHGISSALLGAHVLRRAHERAHIGDGLVIAGLFDHEPRDAEVEDFDLVAAVGQTLEMYVSRLQISMNDPLLVGLGQRSRDGPRHGTRATLVEAPSCTMKRAKLGPSRYSIAMKGRPETSSTPKSWTWTILE